MISSSDCEWRETLHLQRLRSESRRNMNRGLFLIALLTAATCAAQEQMPSAQASPSAATAPAAPQEQTIVIPAGTRIPLSLSSPVPAKLAKPGYAVRAVSVFPVTVGAQLAIPVGTYVEGAIEKVKKVSSSGPSMQVHFTRIVFPSGYAVPVDAANTQAQAGADGSDAPIVATTAGESAGGAGVPAFALAAQQPPTPPPLKNPGPPIGAVVGASVAVMAVAITSAIWWSRHHAGSSGVLFDAGWQFDMVLNSPVSVNAASIAAASGAAR